MSREEGIWLVDAKRSAAGYWLVYGLGILQLFGAGTLVLHGGSLAGYVLGAIVGLSALLFLSVARTLGAGKGGVAFMPQGRKLVMYGTSETDTLDIPAPDGSGFVVRRRKEFWGREAEPRLISSVEFVSGGISYLLFEPRTLEDAEEAALTFRTATGFPILTEDGRKTNEGRGDEQQPVAGMDAPESFLLPRGTTHALWGPTLLLALFALVTGGLLLATVKSTGVVGFLFGPFLAAVGASCLALWVVRSFGVEKLTLFDDGVELQLALGGKRLMRQTLTVEGPGAYARLRTKGAMGFRLEFVAGTQVLTAGTGSSHRGALKPRRLVEIAAAFGKAVRRG
jgi:hypothetical protein